MKPAENAAYEEGKGPLSDRAPLTSLNEPREERASKTFIASIMVLNRYLNFVE